MDVVGVGGQPRFEGRHGERVELARGEIGDPGEEIVADLLGGVPCDPRRHAVCRDVPQNREDGADEHEQPGEVDVLPVSGRDDVVDDRGEEHREKEIHDRPAEFKGEAEHHLAEKRADIAENMFQAARLLSSVKMRFPHYNIKIAVNQPRRIFKTWIIFSSGGPFFTNPTKKKRCYPQITPQRRYFDQTRFAKIFCIRVSGKRRSMNRQNAFEAAIPLVRPYQR